MSNWHSNWHTDEVGWEIPPHAIQYHSEWKTPTIKESLMTPTPIWNPDFDKFFADTVGHFNKQILAARKTPEQTFRDLDVQEGDRIRLTEGKPRDLLRPNGPLIAKTDGAVLEGRVVGIKVRNGHSEVRVAGFDHTGGEAGGQHVWFPVGAYKVEVLHKAYRLTDDDRVLIAIAGISESVWKTLSDHRRDLHRENWGNRVRKVKALLAPPAEEQGVNPVDAFGG